MINKAKEKYYRGGGKGLGGFTGTTAAGGQAGFEYCGVAACHVKVCHAATQLSGLLSGNEIMGGHRARAAGSVSMHRFPALVYEL